MTSTPNLHGYPPAPAPAPAPAFDPMGLADVVTLSAKTRSSLTWDLALAHDIGRLRAMEPFIPFITESGAMDLSLAALIIFVADATWIEPLVTRLETLFIAGRRQIHRNSYNFNDFGPLVTNLAMHALSHHLSAPQTPCSSRVLLGLDKSLLLARSACLPTLGYFTDNPNDLPYGFLSLPRPVRDICHLEFKRLGLPHIRPTPISIALALEASGEPALLDVLLARPEAINKMGQNVFAHYAYPEERHSEFQVLHSPTFWAQVPNLGFKLMAHARRLIDHSELVLHDALILAVAQSSAWDASNPALRHILDDYGSTLFSRLFDCNNIPRLELFNHVITLASVDDFFKPACLCLMEHVFDLSHPSRIIEPSTRWKCLQSALFSTLPGVAELAQAAWYTTQDADPYVACSRSSHIEHHIQAICDCGRSDLVVRGLDAIGIQLAQDFPSSHRKGLDSSFSMWVAQRAPLHIFKTVIDWFDSHGGLAEQAAAKAWVYQGADTRKKGDLLAYCVARGSIEHARFLMLRLPLLDTKPARDVAKSMASKVSGDAACIALSAWETLLLSKMIKVQPDTGPLNLSVEPPKSRHRL